MQGTVSTFDLSTRTGAVLLDDGVELPFEAAAIEGSGLRLLRPGQRVRVESAAEGDPPQVRRIRVYTVPSPRT
jgi:2-phospho-L-lactate guanylyltransferase